MKKTSTIGFIIIFILLISKLVLAQGMPANPSPADETAIYDARPTFSWDGVSNATGYFLELADNPSFDPLLKAVETSDTNYTISSTYLGGDGVRTTFYWRVRAVKNTLPSWDSGWSGPWEFYLYPPKLLTPLSGSDTVSNIVTFLWENAGADTYTIQLDDASNFTSPDTTTVSATNSCTIYIGKNGTYYWRVRASDGANTGVQSNWSHAAFASNVWTIRVRGPELISLPNDSITNNLRPSFAWEKVTDNSADTYSFQISAHNTFTSPWHSSDTTTSPYNLPVDLAEGTWFWRVKCNVGCVSNWSKVSAFIIEPISTEGPNPPTLFTPADGAYQDTSTPFFNWNGQSDISYYQIQIDQDESFSIPDSDDTLINAAPTNTFYRSTVTLPDRTYWWRVRAVNTSHRLGNWSIHRKVIIDTADPAAVTLISPSNSSYTNDPTPFFDWNDPEPQLTYTIQADNTDSTISSPELNKSGLTASQLESTHNWGGTGDTTAWWRVIAVDNAGNTTASTVWKVFIDINAPSASTLKSPASGSYSIDPSPTFEWYAAIDTDNMSDTGNQTYTLQVAEIATGFTTPVEVITGITGAAYSLSLLDGSYLWRIKAYDAAGNGSGWSAEWLLVIDTVAPSQPVLVSPTNGSTTNDTTPIFDWKDVTDENLSYYTIVADTDGINLTSGWIIYDTLTGSPPLSYYQYYGTGFGEVTTYYWQVKAFDRAGNQGPSAIWHIKFDATAPTDPVLVSPSHGSVTNDNTPSFDWDDVNGGESVISCRLQIAENNAFAPVVLEADDLAASTYTLYAYQALSDGVYYWRAMATDAAGNESAGNNKFSLTIDTTAPDSPTLTNPPPGADVVVGSNPTFTWQAVTGAASYDLQTDDNPDFSSPVRNVSGIAPTAPATSYIPDPVLPEGTYYWRVRARDAAGNIGNWRRSNESPGSVTIDTTAPDAPYLTSPADGAYLKESRPWFSWPAVTDSVTAGALTFDTIYYTIQFSAVSDFANTYSVYTNYPYAGNSTWYHPEYFSDPMFNSCNISFPDGTYYWRISATDYAGNESSFSAGRTFVVDTTAPSAPTLVAPATGSVVNTDTSTLIFNWTDVAGATYTLQVDNNNDFSSPAISITSTSSSYTVTTSPPDGNYYWRVKASDQAGNGSAWSTETWVVIIDTQSGGNFSFPRPITPTHLSSTADTTPTFEWTAVTEGISPPITYTLQIDDNGSFSSPEIFTTTSTSYPHMTVMSEGIYYWRVQGEDAAHNNTNWSETVQFKVDTTTPSGPALILPANSGTSNAYPTFRWSAAADTSGVTYTLQIDLEDSALTTPEIELTNYSDISYTVSTALVVGKTYYWRVRARDVAGNPTEWSPIWSVTISPTYLNRINGQIRPLAIAGSDTWTLANSPYVSEDDLIINELATLTIEPGVVIKFKPGENISLLVKGLLNASGTSSHSITFTSNADTPQACDWRGIVFADQSNDSSVLHYCNILYAGSQNSLKQDAVELRSASPTISNSRIAKSCGYGIYARGNSHPRISSCTITENESSGILFEVPGGTLNIDTCTITWNEGWGIENLGDPWLGNTTNFNINGCTISENTSGGINTNASSLETITHNRIKDNSGWAVVKGKHSLADSIGGYVIRDNDISGNKYNGIHLTEPKHSRGTIWYKNWNNADNIPAPIYFERVSIDPGVSLSIKPGVVAKIGQDLTIKGTILAEGTDSGNNSVIFTSYQDDRTGGDTNYDGATTGNKGDWNFVCLDDASDSSTFDYCILRYSMYGLELKSCSPIIKRSIFEENTYRAIGCKNGASPTITGNTMRNNGGFDPHSLEGGIITTFGYDAAKPTITNNRIINNIGNYPILITADNAGRLSSNTMTGNTYNAIRIQEVAADAGIDTNVTWAETGAAFLITGGLIVKDNAKWTIDTGVVVKIIGSVNINGWIAAGGSSSSMVTFTSWFDDQAGGDSNGDGSTTSPSQCDWGEITLNQDSDSSTFEYVLIRYASVGLTCVSSSPAIKQSQFTNCLTAINCNLGASPTITGVIMANNNLGLLTGASSSPTLSGSDIYGNNFGVLNTDNSIIINARNNWWGHLAGPKDSSLVGPGYNPAGLGNEVSDYVDYSSWRTAGRTPTANAGPDRTVSVSSLVMLDGTGSSDPEGDALTYIWTSVAGNPAPVTLTNVARPTFTPTTVGTYLFSLVVSDGGNNSLPDQVTVTVAAPSTNISLRFGQASYTVTPGAQVEVKVEVGSTAFPVSDMFGLFIKVNFLDSSYLSVVDVEAGDFLIGAGKNASSLVGPTWQVDNGNLEVGISRKGTDYTKGASGQGTVVKITFELSSTFTQGTTIDLTFSDVVAKDSNNSPYGLTTSSSRIIAGAGMVQYLTVWPGDTNNDGYVDARDVLPIGLYWNKTGSARSDASISWIRQRVLSWTPTAAAYADANGDGTVNASDVLVLGLNWHKRHNGSSSAPEKSFEFGAPAARPARSCGSSSFEFEAPAARPARPCESSSSEEAQVTEGIDHSRHLAAYRAMYAALEGASSNQDAIREIREFLGSLIQQGLAATIPSATTLLQNYPNPINPETWIPFALERKAEVRIRIYDLSGRLVRELPLGELAAGSYMSKDRAAYWDGRNIYGEEAASGVYLYQLQAGNRILTKRMIVVK